MAGSSIFKNDFSKSLEAIVKIYIKKNIPILFVYSTKDTVVK
jgi:hypothetical protein